MLAEAQLRHRPTLDAELDLGNSSRGKLWLACHSLSTETSCEYFVCNVMRHLKLLKRDSFIFVRDEMRTHRVAVLHVSTHKRQRWPMLVLPPVLRWRRRWVRPRSPGRTLALCCPTRRTERFLLRTVPRAMRGPKSLSGWRDRGRQNAEATMTLDEMDPL